MFLLSCPLRESLVRLLMRKLSTLCEQSGTTVNNMGYRKNAIDPLLPFILMASDPRAVVYYTFFQRGL
jgi:hypothetical protein